MPPVKPTSPETAWPVRVFNAQVKGWIDRLGQAWVEGELIDVKTSPKWALAYLTMHDTDADESIDMTCPKALVRDAPTPIKRGDRVVVLGKPTYYTKKGRFSLSVSKIQHVGLGDLLAKIEALRAQLASEGLCDPQRKKPIPFLPRRIGLITGRNSAAERDVLSVSEQRWPEVNFVIRYSIVQGPTAAANVIDCLKQLEVIDDVDVIIIARGGGSVEDLLPFSAESLSRAVAACPKPVVSAIGHEPDRPVLDDVADLRAATPTDAAKRVVPDAALERQRLAECKDRLSGALRSWVASHEQHIAALTSRPVLADPFTPITARAEDVDRLTDRLNREIDSLLTRSVADTAGLRSRVMALGPAATLARGYSVVQVIPKDHTSPQVVTTIEQAPPGSQLRIRVADGSIGAAAISTTPAD